MFFSRYSWFVMLIPVLVAGVHGATRGYVIGLHAMNGNKSSVQLFCQQNSFKYLDCEDGAGEPTDNLPRIYYGFSVGGNWTYKHTALKASKVVCATPIGCQHDPYNPGYASVPIFQINGQNDWGSQSRDMVAEDVKKGSREAFAWSWGYSHSVGDAWDPIVCFWQECVRLRCTPGSNALKDIPLESGWLADMSSWYSNAPYIAPYKEYAGNKDKACWLPSRYAAYLWRGFCVGSSTWRTSPIALISPAKYNGQDIGFFQRIVGGSSLNIQLSSSIASIARIGVYYGDNLITMLPRNAYNFYNCTWKAVVPGVHPLLAVGYDTAGTPVAVSQSRTLEITGTLGNYETPVAHRDNPVVSRVKKRPSGIANRGPSFLQMNGTTILNGRRVARGLPGKQVRLY